RYSNGYPQKTSNPRISSEEVIKLSRRLADLESRHFHSQQKSQNQNTVHKYESLKTSQMQLSLEMEKLKYQTKLTMDWKKNIETQLYNLNQSISVFQNSKKETDLHWLSIKDRLMVIDKVQMDLNFLRDSFIQEQTYSRQTNNNIQQDLNSLKDLFTQENATTAAVFNGHKVAIDRLKHDTEDIKKMFEEQKVKFTNIVFDLRAASQIASEASERIEIHERDFAEVKKELDQIKLDMEILEGLSSSCDNNFGSGRLIWRITEVENKMQRAKDFDIVLKSPIFYTHEYGYKIRGKPFSKYITAKRQCGDEEGEEPQESSSTFIFIPHTTLLKQNFVKENTLFIEIKIQQNTKLETSL
ncbi:hypothetical protein NQ314_002150, partial [Rhamnusium bicolor]